MKYKFQRQDAIPELETHAQGHCIHIGKISPGCRGCFTAEPHSGVQIGNNCMKNCNYCYYDRKIVDTERYEHRIKDIISDFFRNSLNDNWKPICFSYQSSGETLLYLDHFEQIARILNHVSMRSGIRHYYFLYTNGLLVNKEVLHRLKEFPVYELRFHLGATNFSEEVFKNMELAGKYGFTLTVETPSYPPHREQILGMLPRIEDLGVTHVDLVETQITAHNKEKIAKEYPEAVIYKDYFYHLFDKGLVYDVMEERIARNHTYSVLDCNSGVERCRHGKHQHVGFEMNSIEGMCADWNYNL